ncbi:MAG: hypothetical protein ABJN57_14340 [Hyphomicrobiales bacterium]
MIVCSSKKYINNNLLFVLLLSCIFLHDLFVLFKGLSNPLADLHSFRQTQTALSAYWILHGADFLNYETPVLGTPWAIPFEFPFYHWHTVLLASFGIPLDAAGRLISFVYFSACIGPIYIIYKRLGLSNTTYLITCILYLSSPIYIYWGRTFMIETTALFYGLLWLALFIESFHSSKWYLFWGTLLAGTLGVLTKSTTFPAFAFLGGLYFLYQLYSNWQQDKKLYSLLNFQWAVRVLLLTVPFIPGILWVIHSDALKLLNPLGEYLTSSSLSKWNFGTLEQKLSYKLWWETIWNRVLPDTLGVIIYLLIGFVVFLLFSCRFRVKVFSLFSKGEKLLILITLFAFFLPLLIFTNLHVVHNYYQVANAIFIIISLSIALGALEEKINTNYVVVFVILVSLSQTFYFYKKYYNQVNRTDTNLLRVSKELKKVTPRDSGVLVVGIDWTSFVAYYSERKTLTVPNWIPKHILDQVVENPQKFLGKHKLAAIVICNYKAAAHVINKIKPLLKEKKKDFKHGNCEVYL